MFLNYFLDPLLRAPTIGCMLISLSASLVGVVAFLRKESLLGESLSHASYPGVIIGVIISGTLFSERDSWTFLPIVTMFGAFISAMGGIWLLHFLERRVKIRSDSALCFVLASFFGIGITIASFVQFSHTALYKQALGYLYGQAATLTDIHILIYGALSSVIIIATIFLYKELQIITFDRDYALSLGMRVNVFDTVFFLLITLAIVLGIRTVGVVLMSGMLIAPAVAARQYTNRLSLILPIAGFIGLLSGFIGNVLSNELTSYLNDFFPEHRLSLPTGPMIVITASIICFFSLLFAPERGLVFRFIRMFNFRYKCLSENLLKSMWREGKDKIFSLKSINIYHNISALYLKFILFRLRKLGWVDIIKPGYYRLSDKGVIRGAHIVRLHRLWEVYLADYLGVGADRVHRSAEEMEHIITPELELELTTLLQDPKLDPHHQPIPKVC